jgi:hypothetical protein
MSVLAPECRLHNYLGLWRTFGEIPSNSNHPLSRKGARLAKYGNQTVVCWDAVNSPAFGVRRNHRGNAARLEGGPFTTGSKCEPDRARVGAVVNV